MNTIILSTLSDFALNHASDQTVLDRLISLVQGARDDYYAYRSKYSSDDYFMKEQQQQQDAKGWIELNRGTIEDVITTELPTSTTKYPTDDIEEGFEVLITTELPTSTTKHPTDYKQPNMTNDAMVNNEEMIPENVLRERERIQPVDLLITRERLIDPTHGRVHQGLPLLGEELTTDQMQMPLPVIPILPRPYTEASPESNSPNDVLIGLADDKLSDNKDPAKKSLVLKTYDVDPQKEFKKKSQPKDEKVEDRLVIEILDYVSKLPVVQIKATKKSTEEQLANAVVIDPILKKTGSIATFLGSLIPDVKVYDTDSKSEGDKMADQADAKTATTKKDVIANKGEDNYEEESPYGNDEASPYDMDQIPPKGPKDSHLKKEIQSLPSTTQTVKAPTFYFDPKGVETSDADLDVITDSFKLWMTSAGFTEYCNYYHC